MRDKVLFNQWLQNLLALAKTFYKTLKTNHKIISTCKGKAAVFAILLTTNVMLNSPTDFSFPSIVPMPYSINSNRLKQIQTNLQKLRIFMEICPYRHQSELHCL